MSDTTELFARYAQRKVDTMGIEDIIKDVKARIEFDLAEMPTEEALETIKANGFETMLAGQEKCPMPVEERRQAIVDDWYDTCLSDSGFLRSVLQDRVATMTEAEVAEAYSDAGLGSNDHDY
ncbi:hypothetical protein [Halomonas sp. I5-271120]|uniref:hypothetical protein n=1 Tax=Halomonas sp. I5-271120 TaxID=3061632 RepID=UPI0027145908|nr:hypothetical protein [Halomonas sp. I5-271120]